MLQTQWLRRLESRSGEIAADPATAAMSDSSKPNLSSIVCWPKCDGQTILLTGDARGDYIIDRTADRAACQERQAARRDVPKVPHHGSNRNTTPDLFGAITADAHVLTSADGRHGNPKVDTMKWIAEAARHRRPADHPGRFTNPYRHHRRAPGEAAAATWFWLHAPKPSCSGTPSTASRSPPERRDSRRAQPNLRRPRSPLARRRRCLC